MMNPEPAEILSRLRKILWMLRFRQRMRWRAKDCTISYHEDWMVARLTGYLGELERRLREQRQGG
jgi:hypothetical protein